MKQRMADHFKVLIDMFCLLDKIKSIRVQKIRYRGRYMINPCAIFTHLEDVYLERDQNHAC
jgi:hypothetical protein